VGRRAQLFQLPLCSPLGWRLISLVIFPTFLGNLPTSDSLKDVTSSCPRIATPFPRRPKSRNPASFPPGYGLGARFCEASSLPLGSAAPLPRLGVCFSVSSNSAFVRRVVFYSAAWAPILRDNPLRARFSIQTRLSASIPRMSPFLVWRNNPVHDLNGRISPYSEPVSFSSPTSISQT